MHHGDLAEGALPSAVEGLHLHLEGGIGGEADVGVDVARGVHVSDGHQRPALRALGPEGQGVAEAVSVLVLPGHGLGGQRQSIRGPEEN